MATTAKMSFEDFRILQDQADETTRYELDEGDAILTPSPTPLHNLVSFRLRRALHDFARKHALGIVTGEIDFRLSTNTVRKPDVAFIATQTLPFDVHRSPIEGTPTLAIEVISPSNLAQDTAKKIRQYLDAGSQAVWLVYPGLRLIEIHSRTGKRDVTARASLAEGELFGAHTFTLSLTDLFNENPEV
jgi:Uma2 family endonuclease